MSLQKKKTGITQCLKRMYKTWKRCMHTTRTTSEAETDVETESNTGFLPDQLINSGEYEPLLPTTEEHCTQLLKPQKKTQKAGP